MGSTNQPLSRNANMFNADDISSDSSSPKTLSENNNTEKKNGTRAPAECQNMAASNQLTSGSANMLASTANLDSSNPSSLRSSSCCTSYSLEISSSIANEEKDSEPLPLQTFPESNNDQNKQRNLTVRPEDTKLAASVTTSPRTSATKLQPADVTAAKVRQCTDMLENLQMITSKNEEPGLKKDFPSITTNNSKLEAQPVSMLTSQPLKPASITHTEEKDNKSVEDVEDMFYAFVILHALEDAEEAVRLKTRLEKVSSTTGATFAEDFAEPGRSTFRCVEDAINNSAFIMLLLTPNFNTHLNKLNTDSALLNSIEKTHKSNTVIPLLPRENSLTEAELPLELRTKIPMKEKSSTFDLMAKKLLDPVKIRKQKEKWKVEQSIRKRQEQQQQLKEDNKRHKEFFQESEKVRELELQNKQLLKQQQHFQHPSAAAQSQEYLAFSARAQAFGSSATHWQEPKFPHLSGTAWHQPPSNIHIQNAKYIMIGNDSSMTVGACGNNSEDED